MRTSTRVLCSVVMGLMAILFAGGANAETEVIIRFQPGAISFPGVDHGFGSQFQALPEDAEFDLPQLRSGLEALRVLRFRPVAPWFRHMPEKQFDRWGNPVDLVDMTDDYMVAFDEAPDFDLESLLPRVQGLPGVAHAEAPPATEYYFEPSDNLFPLQWGFNNVGGTYHIWNWNGVAWVDSVDCTAGLDIGMVAAWDSVTVPGTKIGVIDSGIYDSHEDLADATAYSISDHGDDWIHGTEVCGVIAGFGSNDIGIAGAARPDGQSSFENLVVCKTGYPIQPGSQEACLSTMTNDNDYYPQVMVVNESFDGPMRRSQYSAVQRDVHRNAYVKGLSIFCAGGNELTMGCHPGGPDSCVVYPAAYDHLVTSVTGIDCKGDNRFVKGDWQDLCAPANDIVTTTADGGYSGSSVGAGSVYGTSLAAPLASSVAAMLIGIGLMNDDALTNDDLFAIMKKSAMDLGPAGVDSAYGYGLLRADSAAALIDWPNDLEGGQEDSFSWSYLGQRQQEFRRIPGVNNNDEQWRTCWVKVYEVDVSASFDTPVDMDVKDAWARPRLSTGLPNESSIDGRCVPGFLGLVPNSISNSGCTLRTYTYKVFADSGYNQCLRWYPIEVPGQGACPRPGLSPRFDFAYLLTPSSSKRSGASADAMSWRRSGLGFEMEMITSSPTPITFEVCDVTGRVVWTGHTEAKAGTAIVEWDGRTNGRVVPNGVYFVRARGETGLLGRSKLVTVR